MQYVKTIVDFEHDNPEFASDLIASIFYQIGLKGVVIEDPTLPPPEGELDGRTRKTATKSAVIGYIPRDERVDENLNFLNRRLMELAARHRIRWQLLCEPVDEENWAEAWKAFFHRQRIGTRMVVQPSWETQAVSGDDALVIEIDPGQAFGTGTHPTTTLCMLMLEKYLNAGSSVLDIGTGSGILMIAAAKLGAGTVWGVDSDPVALEAAKQNLARNAIDSRRWRLIQSHLTGGVDETFDFVVANILSDTIIELMQSIERVLKTDALFIASGIIEHRQAEVVTRMTERGLTILETVVKEQWVCITARRPNGATGSASRARAS